MEVNQQIVISWLKSKKCFVIEELYYGLHNNDVDVLAINVIENRIYDCEVKCRLSTNMYKNLFKKIVAEFKNPLRMKMISRYIGKRNGINLSIEQIFITTKSLLGSEKNRENWKGKFSENNIGVIYLDDILKELSSHASRISKTNDLTTHLLRLLEK